MGGCGSGRQAGHGLAVDKCHEMHSIDLAWLRRKKLLRPGCWSTLRWSRGGQETGSIRLSVVHGGVQLSYRQRCRGDEWQDVSEIVPVVETATQFGGCRSWFRCLACHRRCRILYGGAHFRCRRCMKLKYETQYEPPFARAATGALKIRERLGSKDGIGDLFPPKPKGMHWRTYYRLSERESRLQSAWAAGIMASWSKFERKRD